MEKLNKKGFELSLDFVVRLIVISAMFVLGLMFLAKGITFFMGRI